MLPRLSDEQLLEAVQVRAESRTLDEAARKLGIARSSLSNRLVRAASRGLDGNVPKPLPLGQTLKGVSTLYKTTTDAEGNKSVDTVLEWVKTRDEPSLDDIVGIIKDAFKDFKPAKPIKAPPAPKENLLTLIPCNDWHINLLTWKRETGQNWDLDIAEKVIGEGIEDGINRSPSSGLAIVLGGGDITHSDNNENRTARSGNVLDCDGRHQLGLEVACRLKVRTIDAALRRNDKVIVRVLPGNHDEHTAVAIAYFLAAWYRNEPRVTVDLDASLFFRHRFGRVLIGATHGHTVKQAQMPMLMAHRWAEDWGATKFRYVHTFHVHHSSKMATEGNGCICESHQAPIPQDAWHYGAGFLSGRSLQTITYHRDYGEISRVRVAILDAEQQSKESAS